MNHCCKGFEFHFNASGEPGVSIILTSFSDTPNFVLQFRTIRFGEEALIKSAVKIITATQAPIHFCPWCGKKLARIISKYKGAERDDLRI